MTNDPTSRLAHHLQSGDLREIAVVLVELERERGVVSFSELSDDPFAALETQNEFAVEYTDVAPDGCSVFGYYRASPPTIYVHPSVMGERDNFTLLHEYGHHVQRQHMQWADLWLSLPDWESARVNEAVADSFAAEVLMPEDRMPFSAGPLHARAIRDAHSGSRASRQALVMRAVELAPGSERAVVAITDLDGRVTFARSTCDEPAPRRGAIQPGLKAIPFT